MKCFFSLYKSRLGRGVVVKKEAAYRLKRGKMLVWPVQIARKKDEMF